MKITLLHNADCPSTSETLARLADVLEDEGLSGEVAVEVVLAATDEEAVRLGFAGSPTILVNGLDIESYDAGLSGPAGPAGPELQKADVHLATCRIYRRGDGRSSPLPPVELIRNAVLRAAGRAEV